MSASWLSIDAPTLSIFFPVSIQPARGDFRSACALYGRIRLRGTTGFRSPARCFRSLVLARTKSVTRNCREPAVRFLRRPPVSSGPRRKEIRRPFRRRARRSGRHAAPAPLPRFLRLCAARRSCDCFLLRIRASASYSSRRLLVRPAGSFAVRNGRRIYTLSVPYPGGFLHARTADVIGPGESRRLRRLPRIPVFSARLSAANRIRKSTP